METTVYKLTDQNMQTYNGFQWVIGVPAPELSGEGGLCGPGCYHAYTDPFLALLLNPIHSKIEHPRLFHATASEISDQDHGLKVGVKTMTLFEELPVPEVTTMHRVKFVILVAKETCKDQEWNAWADAWLSGKDRSSAAAWAAWRVMEAVSVPETAAWLAAIVSETEEMAAKAEEEEVEAAVLKAKQKVEWHTAMSATVAAWDGIDIIALAREACM